MLDAEIRLLVGAIVFSIALPRRVLSLYRLKLRENIERVGCAPCTLQMNFSGERESDTLNGSLPAVSRIVHKRRGGRTIIETRLGNWIFAPKPVDYEPHQSTAYEPPAGHLKSHSASIQLKAAHFRSKLQDPKSIRHKPLQFFFVAHGLRDPGNNHGTPIKPKV